MTTQNATFTKDLSKKQITVVRHFDAPVDQVWKAWTTSALLDSWWAPKPWRAETKEMDFREGGHWQYAMVGPDGEKHWSRINYKKIEKNSLVIAEDGFTDENGNATPGMPSMLWNTRFAAAGSATTVTIVINFNKEEDMQKILDMGFEQGFEMGLGNLEELLASKKV
jgi:uncharacterized protein YndB with AHSA1/START domain